MALATKKKTSIGTATHKKIAAKNLKNSEEKSKTEIESSTEESATEASENDSDENEEENASADEDEEVEEDSESEQQAATDNEDEEEEEEEGNAGWADSIAKVLSSTKPKTKKSVVLSRAKKLKQSKEKSTAKAKEDYGFEIEGEIKEEKKPEKDEIKEELKKRKNLALTLRVRPSWKDLERERMLRKVATKGVVQLFNAVRIQQKDLQQQLEEAGPLESRKDAVLNNINKRKFLDVLMSGSRAKSEAVDNTVKIEKNEESTEDDESDEESLDDGSSERKRKTEWSVLRPDYMTNKKIKHWDEEDDSEDNPVESDASVSDDNE